MILGNCWVCVLRVLFHGIRAIRLRFIISNTRRWFSSPIVVVKGIVWSFFVSFVLDRSVCVESSVSLWYLWIFYANCENLSLLFRSMVSALISLNRNKYCFSLGFWYCELLYVLAGWSIAIGGFALINHCCFDIRFGRLISSSEITL